MEHVRPSRPSISWMAPSMASWFARPRCARKHVFSVSSTSPPKGPMEDVGFLSTSSLLHCICIAFRRSSRCSNHLPFLFTNPRRHWGYWAIDIAGWFKIADWFVLLLPPIDPPPLFTFLAGIFWSRLSASNREISPDRALASDHNVALGLLFSNLTRQSWTNFFWCLCLEFVLRKAGLRSINVRSHLP